MERQFCVAAAFMMVVGMACGGSKPPTYQLSQSKAAVRGAVEVNAKDTPQAALYLKIAKDNVRSAEGLIIEREYSKASHLLRRAEADANLAITLAKAEKMKAAAADMKRKLEKLRVETEEQNR